MKKKKPSDYALLRELCAVHAPSGEEAPLRDFLIDYINRHRKHWKHKPTLYHGDGFQDCLVVAFGKPRTAVFAHLDSVGFTVRYQNQLLPIGSPQADPGTVLVGHDSQGEIRCTLAYDAEDHALYQFGRAIDRGTSLTYEPHFRETADYIQSPYLDNRLGVYNALKVAETLKDGVLVFSCWEEHGGGSAGYLMDFVFNKWNVTQALISDITWTTDGVRHGQGVVVSLRDRSIPRKRFLNRITAELDKAKINYQREVEGIGSSDGGELQRMALPIDWCFIGAPEQDPHTPHEKVHKADIEAMIEAYRCLLATLK
ncbi:MAG: M20/M25/M40 family metallo-hydrolase [Cyclobacteriaceae bacterium]|nr:M20/M25/M40 family metallo-hydrolase [Cyclobacteriaceae bacterium]